MTDCSKYRVVVREGGGMDLMTPDNESILCTENVSVQTLVELVAKDKESKR